MPDRFVGMRKRSRKASCYNLRMGEKALSILTAVLLQMQAAPLQAQVSQSGVADDQMFLDIEEHPHRPFIEELALNGIVEGYGYGIFRPDIPINRAEFLKILMTAVFGSEEVVGDQAKCFSDFIGTPQWYWKYACLAKERGIINGYPDGTFRGAQTVNLAEALKISIEAWGLETPELTTASDLWYLPYFAVAAERGLFSYFPARGEHLLTRSEMAYMIVSMGEEIQNANLVKRTVALGGGINASGSSSQPVAPAARAECGNGTVEEGEECDDGNLENGDGCSEICVVVEEPIRHGALRIEQVSAGTPKAALGAKDITLMGFTVLAGRQDSVVTIMKFRAAEGTVNMAENYVLWVDSDEDGEVDQKLADAGGSTGLITFDDLQFNVRNGQQLYVELHADIDREAQEGPLAIEFALDDPLFVQGVGSEDGRDLTGVHVNGGDCNQESVCWISVFTVDPVVTQVQGRGNLYVTKDSVPLAPSQYVAGTTTDELLRFTFRAEAEDIEVTSVEIVGVPNSVSRLLLYDEDSETALAEARFTNCDVPLAGRFCANSDFVIEADAERTIVVKADIKSKEDGGKSGEDLSIKLDPGTSLMPVEARGAQSQIELKKNNADTKAEGEIFIGTSAAGPSQQIASSTNEIFMSKIVEIENANPDVDGTPVTKGELEFGKFRFRSSPEVDGNEGFQNVAIIDLTFDVKAQNVEFVDDSFEVFNLQDSSATVECGANGTTGDITVTCSDIAGFISSTMTPGSAMDLVLKGTVLNAGIAGESSVLQARLSELSDPGTTGTVTWSDGVSTVEWVDIGETSVQSTSYTNGG